MPILVILGSLLRPEEVGAMLFVTLSLLESFLRFRAACILHAHTGLGSLAVPCVRAWRPCCLRHCHSCKLLKYSFFTSAMQASFMPILVLAARLCPEGVEATLFATLMSILNGAFPGNMMSAECDVGAGVALEGWVQKL